MSQSACPAILGMSVNCPRVTGTGVTFLGRGWQNNRIAMPGMLPARNWNQQRTDDETCTKTKTDSSILVLDHSHLAHPTLGILGR